MLPGLGATCGVGVLAVGETERFRVLVVEDEDAILEGIRDNLELEGYDVVVARDGNEGWIRFQEARPDIAVLDVMLPRLNGLDLCRKIKEQAPEMPVIFLSAKGQEVDKVRGLESGADDYIAKPFGVMEFLARIKAALRRKTLSGAAPAERFTFGDIEVDFERMEVKKATKRVVLSPREFKILAFLIENRGKVVSRNLLLNKVWGYTHLPETRTVDNHIVKLRKAIEDEPANPRFIVSVRGMGYRFIPEGLDA
jgi:DNA-binding response OmpR family regulator